MGFFDSIKKAVGGVAGQVQDQVQNAVAPPQAQHAPQHAQHAQPEPEAVEEASSSDVAGFDPSDEEAFFNAVINVESDGQKMAATDESPEQIWARYGVRDHSHWRDVKDAMYRALAEQHGGFEAVMQRQANWRMGQVQRHMQGQTAAKAKSGELNPVEGISIEFWAATNAAIVQGSSPDDLLKGAGIDKARWDRARAEWEARMARDTTFAIAQIYGNAFQAASKGKYAAFAKEANEARAANRELGMEPPMPLEQYFDIMYEQSSATNQGKDPTEALKSLGLSVVDWCDLSSFMGYHIHRKYAAKAEIIHNMMERSRLKCEAKYPGVRTDVDITF
jgi:hypothetical protein